MERAVFGASEFFSSKAFRTSLRGIEQIRIEHQTEANVDIVEIWFNPWKVSYQELLDLFFDLHDPILRAGQESNQSFIFFTNQTQLTIAKQKKNELKKLANHPIITTITPASQNSLGVDERLLIS